MIDVDALIEASAKKVPVGSHMSPNWLARVPKEDLPAVRNFLRNSMGLRKVRTIYRDKSTDRPKQYYKSTLGRGTSGWSSKANATHADIYSNDASLLGGSSSYALRLIRAGSKPNKYLLSAIAASPQASYDYAVNVLKKPWSPGEPAIMKDPILHSRYIKFLNSHYPMDVTDVLDSGKPWKTH